MAPGSWLGGSVQSTAFLQLSLLNSLRPTQHFTSLFTNLYDPSYTLPLPLPPPPRECASGRHTARIFSVLYRRTQSPWDVARWWPLHSKWVMEPEHKPRSLGTQLFLHHFPTRAFLGHKCVVYPTPFAITKEQLCEACWVEYKHR